MRPDCRFAYIDYLCAFNCYIESVMSYHIESFGGIALHRVGNKSADDGCLLSQGLLKTDEQVESVLHSYFINRFKGGGHYALRCDGAPNKVYDAVSSIFDNPDTLYERSLDIARHLYDQSTHPKVRAGAFYVAYFSEAVIDGEVADAVGLFKAESTETFLRLVPSESGLTLECDQGVALDRLERACLIFNIDRADGYVLAVEEGRGQEASFWIDDFLVAAPKRDDHYNTSNVLSLCRDFVTKELPEQFEVTKADQAEMLNRSVQYFKDNDNFDIGQFSEQVIMQPEVIESFTRYKSDYEQERDVEIADTFDISCEAVKKQSRSFKSVIKLDRNFHVYVHGDNKYLRRGYDDQVGMHYYQLFFKEEE